MIKCIDLFAGVGGIRLGLSKAALKHKITTECVFTSEINKFAIETYSANFGKKHIFGDITQINVKEIPKHDILLAGFPCQPFSQAGLRKGFNDTRGTLFFNIQKILEEKKPKAFLLENVKHLKGHDKGNTLKVIINNLNLLGYKTYYEVLNARDFGLPQNRERLIIVGFLNHKVDFKFPKKSKKNTLVGNILESKVDPKYTISDVLWAGHQRRKKDHGIKGNGFGYSLFNKNSEYTNTISARYYKDGSEALIEQKNKNPRKLTPRECARLQGSPDSFKIPVSDNQAYRQFGNSVPVNMIKAVCAEIISAPNSGLTKKKSKK